MAGSLVKHDIDSRGTIRLWQEIRTFLDAEFPAAAMVSEWGEPDKSLQGGFHMDFLLHFGSSHYNDLFRCAEPFFSQRGKGDVSAFVQKYLENYEKSERKGLICIPSGNHDMDRLARSIQGDNLKIAFAFLLSMPGAPFIYYGDEIGMRYIENMPSVEGGYGRTGSRLAHAVGQLGERGLLYRAQGEVVHPAGRERRPPHRRCPDGRRKLPVP